MKLPIDWAALDNARGGSCSVMVCRCGRDGIAKSFAHTMAVHAACGGSQQSFLQYDVSVAGAKTIWADFVVYLGKVSATGSVGLKDQAGERCVG